MKNINIKILLVAVVGLSFMACEPQLSMERPDIGQAPTENDISFTITPGEDDNHWVITNTSTITGILKWEFRNGEKSSEEEIVVFYPDVQTYTITLTILNRSGAISKSMDHEQTVASAPPLGSNLIKGGEFKDATDHAYWNLMPNGFYVGTSTFNEGNVHFTISDAWTQAGIYQEVQVEAGKSYHLDMHVESTSGLGDSWFEVYTGYAAPTDADYTDGDMKLSINTWDGCGTAPFSGQILDVGCNGDKNTGLFEAPTTGTVYFVIRSGGGAYNDGVIFTNIEMREYLNK